MSRCGQTGALLHAVFAGTDLTRAQEEHVRGCAECARAMSQARRFESELGRVGIELTPQPMPAAADLAATPAAPEGERMVRRRDVVGGAVAVIGIVAVLVGGSQWLGSIMRGEFAPSHAPPVTAARAAGMVGVAPDEVLVTEDGALAIRDLGLRMELILVTSSGDGPVAKVIDATPAGSGPTLFSAISCVEDEQLERTDYVWGRWEEVTDVRGAGEFIVTDSNHLIFAYDPDPPNPTTPLEVVEGVNGSMNFGPAGSLGKRPCLATDMDETAQPRLPADLRCSDWSRMADDRTAIAEALIGDELLPAIRDLQQLPLSARGTT